MSAEQNSGEESKAEELNKKSRLILIGGIALLILPLLIILLYKLAALHGTQASQMNGSMFYARTVKVGDKLTPAPTPAPSNVAPSLTPPPAANQSSLNLIVGDKGQQAPPPPEAKKKIKKPFKTSKPKSLAQVKPRQPSKTVQPFSIPHLKPSPFGNPAAQGGSPIPSVGGGAQPPNAGQMIQNIMKNMPQGQGVPANVQQMIQQSAQQTGGAPAVPAPTGQ